MYCAHCSNKLTTVKGDPETKQIKILMCTICGAGYQHIEGTTWRFMGFTAGNNEVREYINAEENK